MATSAVTHRIPGLVVGSSDVTTSQYYFVKLASTAGQVKVVTASTDSAIGVLYNKPKANGAAEVAAGGTVKVKSGGTITAGAKVGWNSTGLAEAKTTDADLYVGVALTAADSNDVFPIAWVGLSSLSTA